MVNIEIDGMPVQARDGAMIIEAADDAGVAIPRFCYHKKLSIAANCRMCLVEVEKAAKPLPACATPVNEGMKIYTRSRRALDAQQGTMEFLLINHPLDCPICDQGGECELQDVAVGYGGDHSRFGENKRVVDDPDLGALIETDMTRCIHCTRCVRFGEEIAGIKELGATGRGEHMRIGTYVQRAVVSELSGNVIDLCPVGALTSKPFRYSARPWELVSSPAVAPHDCVGSNIYIHTRRNTVMRVLPRENEDINETWISDRDRFSYESLNGDDRLRKPMVKRDGRWEEVEWEAALAAAATACKSAMLAGGGGKIGALISPSATVEEMYLAQKLLRGLGGGNIDHRLREQDFTDQNAFPVYPGLGQSLAAIEEADRILLIGGNIRKDQPLAGHRVRKAALRGARVMAVNPIDYDFRFPVSEKIIASPAGMERALAAIAKVLMESRAAKHPVNIDALVTGARPEEIHRTIAARLQVGKSRVVLLGSQAAAHPAASTLRALAAAIAELSGATLGFLTGGANGAGAWLAGAVPHRGPAGKAAAAPGLDARAMLAAGLKTYVLLNVEPELDCADGGAALAALKSAAHVVALTPFVSAALKECATVLLPIGAFAETSGTYVNAEGRWQSFNGAAPCPGEARPAWKVLRVLGNVLQLDGFDYMASTDVRDELAALARDLAPGRYSAGKAAGALSAEVQGYARLADVPLYAVDGVARRAASLQRTLDACAAAVYINEREAARLGVIEGAPVRVRVEGVEAVLPVTSDARIPDGCAWIPAGLRETVGMGAYGAPLRITKG